MTDPGEHKSQSDSKENLVICVRSQVDSCESHKHDVGYDDCSHRHFNDVGRAEDRHAFAFDADVIVEVQVDCVPEEDVIRHMARRIAKPCVALAE